MTRLAIADTPGKLFVIDERELRRNTPSWTVETFKVLRSEYGPMAPLGLIIGQDSLLTLPQWHRSQELFELCHILVCARPGYQYGIAGYKNNNWMEYRFTDDPSALNYQPAGLVYCAETPELAISASDIRGRVHAILPYYDLLTHSYINKLLTGNRAAVVVIDPRDSGILALVSNPSFNPNLFVEGISSNDYQNLLNDHNYPLINRVTQGLYPPASTVKPYIAVSALTVGVINEYFSIFDPGWWQLPGSGKRYRDWKHYGHGKLNIIKAIEESADTLFYQVAYDMGIDLLAEWMMKFGYGHYTGIDITEEHTGIMPTRNWKMKRFHEPWYPGDTIVVGIGQGYWTATPLQILKALVTLINNGSVYKPHLLLGTREQDDNIISYHQYEETNIGDPYSGFWEIAKDGMYGVANHPNGTARHYFANTPYKTAAKSGTAQVYSLKANEKYNVHKINERLRDHKWMTAFAPYDNPTVCVVVLLENGGIGPSAGNICTRRCPFCNVAHGRPLIPDIHEPEKLAETITNMGLRYVVITSVNRDDLYDGGAQHFVDCIRAIRAKNSATRIEVLVPDFRGHMKTALEILNTSPPDVFNHNIENVPRLYRHIRPGADYHRSLKLLKKFKEYNPSLPTKSGLMMGLGETREEIIEVMRDLRQHNVTMLTLGQYLQPSSNHLPVQRYITPQEFNEMKLESLAMGFTYAACGPFVRSSYHADLQNKGIEVK
ncbi:hypothetical protein J6590_060074 [Homalodisca vitripennis]|nr:hypothetical protein J6590_060074 [Homalodisca vitripennis]